MLPGLYSAASGLGAALLNQEVVARNLAHVSVPGFRRSTISFKTLESAAQETDGSSSIGVTQAGETRVDFTQGKIQTTGRPLDVALNGDGFFVLEGPDGPLYTRNGVFHLNEEGYLVNAHGLKVNGSSGPIIVPPNTPPSGIVVGKDGSVRVGNLPIGQLQITKFRDNNQLTSVGTTLFEAAPGADSETSDAAAEQGARELSNVGSVDELVMMIAGLRYYEASQRAIRTIAEAVQQNTNPETG